MSVKSDTDFLPWILGALVAAIAALALAIHDAPDSRQAGPAPVARSAESPAAGESPAAPPRSAPPQAQPPAPQTLPVPVAPEPQPASRADLPPGQVYECTRQGQHIFSDSPCGERAAIRQLNAVNRMAPVAVIPDPDRPPPAPNPVREANYTLPPDEPQQTDPTPRVLLYPVPVLPYRYHGRPEHENHPRNMPRSPPNHAGARDLGSPGR